MNVTQIRVSCPVSPAPAEAISPGLDLWACYPPFDDDDNPAYAVSIDVGLEQTVAVRLAEAVAMEPGEFTGAREIRAWDGAGVLQMRREVVVV